MGAILAFLRGKKTYSVVLAAALLALSHVAGGEASFLDAIKEMLPFLGLGAIRGAIGSR